MISSSDTALPAWQVALVLVLWAVAFAAWLIRSNVILIRALPWRKRLVLLAVLLASGVVGGDKLPVSLNIFRLLFWDPGQPWQLAAVRSALDDSAAGVAQAASDNAEVEAATNAVYTLSFDWHARGRLPYHDRQNVMASTVWVSPTNINGVVYEDHFVTFNAAASTNPAVIYIEYARKLDDGGVERYTQRTVTNSYPDTTVFNLSSGSYTCYWFRCEVPPAFTNGCCVRDWNGEALFGSPDGSDRGFDLLGTLVVDDGGDVWVGATTNLYFGGITNEFKNGINITQQGN